MKKTKRFSLGLLSSLLLAVGFVRAADRVDSAVINPDAVNIDNFTAMPANSCSVPCMAED